MNINSLSDKIVYTLKLPYKGDHGTNLIKSIKISTKKSLYNIISLSCHEQVSLSGLRFERYLKKKKYYGVYSDLIK